MVIAPTIDEYGYKELDQSVYDALDLFELEQAYGQTAQTVQQSSGKTGAENRSINYLNFVILESTDNASTKNKMTNEELRDASEFSQRRE